MVKKIGMLIVVSMLVMAGASASAKDLLIVDVYFDDGSVLHNAKFKPHSNSDKIKVKHKDSFFTLHFEDLKILEFGVEPGTSQVKVCDTGGSPCNNIGKEAIVTLKIKIKTGGVVNDRFSTAEGRAIYYQNNLCTARSFSFVSKLTGKEVTKSYGITNLGSRYHGGKTGCFFQNGVAKAISSIVFKNGIEKETEKGLTQWTNISPQGAELKIIGALEKAAKVLNKSTPRMVDEYTRMDATTIGPGFRININYTLPKHSAGEIDADQLVQQIRPTLKNYACSKKNTKLLLQYGADIAYLYHDKDGMLITSITIDRNDCGLRKISP